MVNDDSVAVASHVPAGHDSSVSLHRWVCLSAKIDAGMCSFRCSKLVDSIAESAGHASTANWPRKSATEWNQRTTFSARLPFYDFAGACCFLLRAHPAGFREGLPSVEIFEQSNLVFICFSKDSVPVSAATSGH